MQSFKSIPTLVLDIWGKKGSELGVFGIFSKSITSIWFILSGKEDIIELHTCAKFHVHTNFGSRDMGQKGVRIGGFRHLLKKYHFDLVHSLRKRRYYRVTYMYRVSSPYQLWFLRYGGKRGLILGFSAFSRKISV